MKCSHRKIRQWYTEPSVIHQYIYSTVFWHSSSLWWHTCSQFCVWLSHHHLDRTDLWWKCSSRCMYFPCFKHILVSFKTKLTLQTGPFLARKQYSIWHFCTFRLTAHHSHGHTRSKYDHMELWAEQRIATFCKSTILCYTVNQVHYHKKHNAVIQPCIVLLLTGIMH